MKKSLLSLSLSISLWLLVSSCSPSAYSTLPQQPHMAKVAHERQPEAVLYIPTGLQVISVDYDAEFFTISSDGTTRREGEEGRAFINVLAVDKQSGEQYLLIYENLRPIQVIRFQEE